MTPDIDLNQIAKVVAMRPRVVVWAVVSSVRAFAPLQRRITDTSWTPARETHAEARLGWSPAPTRAPAGPRYGYMDLVRPRADDFTLGTSTCGYVSGFNSPVPVTCVRESAYCTNDGVANMDCCSGDYTACTSTMYSACLDLSASQRGECNDKGARTICWCVSTTDVALLRDVDCEKAGRNHPRATPSYTPRPPPPGRSFLFCSVPPVAAATLSSPPLRG